MSNRILAGSHCNLRLATRTYEEPRVQKSKWTKLNEELTLVRPTLDNLHATSTVGSTLLSVGSKPLSVGSEPFHRGVETTLGGIEGTVGGARGNFTWSLMATFNWITATSGGD